MLRLFAEAASILGSRDDYRQTAIRNAEFIIVQAGSVSDRWAADGKTIPLNHRPSSIVSSSDELRLYRTYKEAGRTSEAFAETTPLTLVFSSRSTKPRSKRDDRDGSQAHALLLGHFWDERAVGFFDRGLHEAAGSQTQELYDNAVPSANSLAADALLRLYLLPPSRIQKYALETMRPFSTCW